MLMDNVLYNSPLKLQWSKGLYSKAKKKEQTQGDTSSTWRGKIVKEGKNVGNPLQTADSI